MSAPIILAAAAAVLLLGGKKKKTTKAAPPVEPDQIPDEGEADEGDGPPIIGEQYGDVGRGVRKDRRGHHAWRVMYEPDGYHAQLMQTAGKFGLLQEDLGVSATLAAAKQMLRDTFNQRLIEKYPNEPPLNDPPITRFKTPGGFLAAPAGGGGGNDGGGLGLDE